MFEPTMDGGVTGWISAGEAELLRTLIGPVMDLLSTDRKPDSAPEDTKLADKTPAHANPGDTKDDDDVFADLERMFDAGAPQTPEDPALARLLPDAYRDDPEAAGEFRKYTESSLREAKKYFAQTLLETLPEQGGSFQLSADQARDWMRALNDMRLLFGVRLEVTEDFEDQLAALDPEDPAVPMFEVYGWLGGVQESLVQAIAG
jgi:hypothetical protein